MHRPEWWFVVPWELHHPGGVNQVVINLYRKMERKGNWKPRILVLRWQDTLPSNGTSAGLPVTYWRVRSPVDGQKNIKSRIRFWLWLPLGLAIWRRITRSVHGGVINIHYPLPSALFFSLARKFNLYQGRLLMSFHGLDVDTIKKATGATRDAYIKMLKEADRVVVCSGSLAQRLSRLNLVNSGRISIVHNGIDPDTFTHTWVKRRGRSSCTTPVVLSVATFEGKKGQDILLSAVSLLNEQDIDCRVILVGRDGPALSSLRKESARQGLSRQVEFHVDVPHDRIEDYYSAADIFVLPSREEPFGIVLLEAGVHALPVVASRVGGIPEIIDDGRHGLLIPPGEPSDLATAIRKLLDTPSLARSLGDQLRKKVMSEFTWHAAAEKYMKIAAETMNAG